MNKKEYFFTDNKSGYKTNEKLLSKHNISIYNEIIEYTIKNNLIDISFKEKVWYFINDVTERVKCSCGKYCKFKGTLSKGFNTYCSVDCFNLIDNGLKVIEANLAKYGAKSFTSTIEGKDKVRNTKLLNHGDANFNNHDKAKKTKLLKHGNEYYNNIEKGKETNIIKYGVYNPSKSLIVKEKIKNTNIEKYGYIEPTQSPEIKLKLKNTLLNNIKKRFSENEFVGYDFDNSEFILNCFKCNNIYKIPNSLYNERKRMGNETCLNCYPIDKLKSFKEIDLFDEIDKFYKNDIIKNDRSVIKQELDLLLPQAKLAIEFNGLYWHSELFKNSKYHLNKTNKCSLLGIELIHLFEDEWIYKKDIVLSIIKYKLGYISDKIFARKCDIKEVDSVTSNKFLNANHLQGSGSKNSYRIGLYYNNELVSLMTFSKGRIALGGESNQWELTRFCNKININVIGSANRLFKKFLIDKDPIKIITYADKRWFSGGVYDKLGFKYTHDSKPNYWYIKNNLRYHRFNYRKDILVKKGFDINKSEKEIMFEMGIYRIYDCGTKVFIYEK